MPLGQAEVGSVPKSVYQLDVLFFGLIKHYTMTYFSLHSCVGKSKILTTNYVLAIVYIFSVI